MSGHKAEVNTFFEDFLNVFDTSEEHRRISLHFFGRFLRLVRISTGWWTCVKDIFR